MGKTKEEKTEKRETRYFVLWDEEKQGDLLKWWQSLEKNTGARAQLRRCAGPEEAALNPQTYQVKQMFGWASYEAAATIAGILSRIKSGEDDPTPLGKKLATPREQGGPPQFSESRFRQLLKSQGWDEFYRNLRRAIQVLRGVINPLRVADVILAWDKESRRENPVTPGKSLRFQLSQQYYTNAPPKKKS